MFYFLQLAIYTCFGGSCFILGIIYERYKKQVKKQVIEYDVFKLEEDDEDDFKDYFPSDAYRTIK